MTPHLDSATKIAGRKARAAVPATRGRSWGPGITPASSRQGFGVQPAQLAKRETSALRGASYYLEHPAGMGVYRRTLVIACFAKDTHDGNHGS